MQNDFVKQGGSLLVPDAEATVPAIRTPAGAGPGQSNARRLQPGHPSQRAIPNGRSGPSTAARAAGGGRSSPSSRPPPTTRSFARSATTRSTAPRSTTCCGCGASTRWSSAAPSRTSPSQYTAASAALRWYGVVIPRDAISALEPFDLEAVVAPDRVRVRRAVTTAGGVRTMASRLLRRAQAGVRLSRNNGECWRWSVRARGCSC